MNVIINDYDEKVFMENLSLFKARLFMLAVDNLDIDEEEKVEILKESVKIIENFDDL